MLSPLLKGRLHRLLNRAVVEIEPGWCAHNLRIDESMPLMREHLAGVVKMGSLGLPGS
jgi:hypothetical protein